MAEILRLLRSNVRNYGMFIALAVIIIVFTIWSKGRFLSSVNVSNLINQTGTVGVMTAGMTLVIIIRHIDLSVGYMCGFMGAVAANLMTNMHVAAVPAILLVLVIGAAIGLVIGMLIGKVGIPSFVVTLAGMFIGRGLMLLATKSGGTITITSKFFNSLVNGFIPSMGRLGGMEMTTVVIGIIGAVAFIVAQIFSRRTKMKYNFDVSSTGVFAAKLVLIVVIIGALDYIMALGKGLSWTVLILGIVIFTFSVVQNKTRFGRFVFGVGGNPEAAELSGVSVVRVTIIVFVIMGALTALGGILLASRMQSASPTAGTGFELLVIAGAYIGGCSAAGGVGKVVGSLVGALIMQALVNGMAMMQVNISYQYIIQGAILVLAVWFDIVTRKTRVSKKSLISELVPTAKKE